MGKIPQLARIRFKFGTTKRRMTSRGGLFWLRSLAEQMGLPALLERIGIKRRRRGSSDAEMLLGATLSLASGGKSLSDADALRGDAALDGLSISMPGSRRLGEYLSRMDAGSLERLRACCARVAG